MTGADHGLVGGSIKSFSAINLISFSASCLFARGSLYGACFIGLVPGSKFISYSTRLVWRKSCEEEENVL